MQEIILKASMTTEYIAVKCSTAKLILVESDPSLITFEKKKKLEALSFFLSFLTSHNQGHQDTKATCIY